MPARYYTQGALYLLNRYILQRKYLTARADEQGMKFVFRIEDGGGRGIYKRGQYEPDLTAYVKRNLKTEPGDVLFDIGANMGWYSVLFSKLCPEGVKIYAFEPEPINYGILCRNLELNQVKNVIPVQKALAEKPGKQILFTYPHKNTGRHSLLPINSGEKIEVETTTLDHFVTEERIDPARVRFIKIDVEGYEYSVFSGARKLLARKPTVLSEYAPHYMRRGGVEPRKLRELFEEMGYDCEEVRREIGSKVNWDEILRNEGCANVCWKKAA